jgi:drug/metabolite transporter (DMT)-like permease
VRDTTSICCRSPRGRWSGPVVVTLPFVAALAFVALPGTALAWLLWMFALSRLPAGTAGLASLATPIIGVFAAWLQLGERPSGTEWVGIALIVAALVVVGAVGLEESRAHVAGRGLPATRSA